MFKTPLAQTKLALLMTMMIFLSPPVAHADCFVLKTMPQEVYDLADPDDMSPFYAAVEKQVAAGNAEAKYFIATKLKLEGPADEDVERMHALLQESAEGGFFQAQMNFGLLLYRRGRYEAAYPYLRAVSECGAWGEAPLALSHMYQEGLGVPRDVGLAQCWNTAAVRPPPFEPVSCP